MRSAPEDALLANIAAYTLWHGTWSFTTEARRHGGKRWTKQRNAHFVSGIY